MDKAEENKEKILLSALVESDFASFLSRSNIPDEVYCVVSDSVDGMHLAINQHVDTTQFNI
jgi:hypothetical protein